MLRLVLENSYAKLGVIRNFLRKFDVGFNVELGVKVKRVKRAIIGLAISINLAVLAGCGATTIPKTKPEGISGANAVSAKSGQSPSALSKFTEKEAVASAQQVLAKLDLKPGEPQKVISGQDSIDLKEYWEVQFPGVSITFDQASGALSGISDMDATTKQTTFKTRDAAEKVAWSLYNQLQAPPGYKLISIKQTNTGDYWDVVWKKEVIPSVYSKYESVSLLFSADKGTLRIYRLFDMPANSLDVIVTKEQAIKTAAPVLKDKGFSNLVDAKLSVEMANNYWRTNAPGTERYATLVWAETFKNSKSHTATVYVDAGNGSVIGGDQSK